MHTEWRTCITMSGCHATRDIHFLSSSLHHSITIWMVSLTATRFIHTDRQTDLHHHHPRRSLAWNFISVTILILMNWIWNIKIFKLSSQNISFLYSNIHLYTAVQRSEVLTFIIKYNLVFKYQTFILAGSVSVLMCWLEYTVVYFPAPYSNNTVAAWCLLICFIKCWKYI